MKKMIMLSVLFFVMTNFAFALDPVKPYVKEKTIYIGNNVYSMEKCVFQDALEAIANADWSYALPLPKGNGHGGDWCDIILLSNGNYGIVYAGLFYEFNAKKCNVTPQNVSNAQFVKYLEGDYFSRFPDNALKNSKKFGYTYADNSKGEVNIILYGYK